MSNNSNNNNSNRGRFNTWRGGNKPWFKKPWFNKNKSNKNQNNDPNSDAPDNNEANNNNNNNYNRNNNNNNGNFNRNRSWNQNKNRNNNFQNKKLYDNNNQNDDVLEDFDDESSNGFIFDSTAKCEDDIAHLVEDNPNCPFQMWNLYFPKEKYKDQSETHQTIKKFIIILDNIKDQFDINNVKERGFFSLDYAEFCNNACLLEKLPNFPRDFVNQPQFYLSCIGLAMHQFILDKFNDLVEKFKNKKCKTNSTCSNDTTDDLQNDIDYHKELSSFSSQHQIPTVKVRILNYPDITKIKKLKSNMYDKFVSITGTVVRISHTKPFVTRLAFQCKKCETTFQLALNEGKYKYPSRCASKLCNSRGFVALEKHFMTKLVNWQKMKLQEVILDPKDVESGRVPRTIECELSEDLTGICSAGDLVIINGIVKALTLESQGAGRSNREKCTFVLFIQVNSVQGMLSNEAKDLNKNKSAKSLKDVEFSQNDFEFFRELSSQPDAFRIIVNSLCPSIFGHELVKAGLILGLFGGARKGDANNVAVRSDPHVLVVGDPGLGKSQLLRACSNISPRGIYVCGNSTTTAGLTVSLSKEGGSDFNLEAGALLCAHNGCCCIDEFDKMGNQQQTLLEAMEQQCISIAKGGIVCTLPCKTTVLAAANPCGGHYDKSKTVSENLKLSGPLLSRFDLLFILLDKPNEELDYKLSSHIISLHSKSKQQSMPGPSYMNSMNERSIMMKSGLNLNVPTTSLQDPNGEESEKIPLATKLQLDQDEIHTFDPVPPKLLRKYIMYAKRNIEPIIGDDAAEVLSAFYVKLRQTNQRSNGCNPITLRQLESLMRLTQARAKVELRTICSKIDAEEVIEIMKSSMVDYYENELEMLDLSRTQSGSGSSKSATIKQFVAILQKLSDEKKKILFNYDEIKEIYDKTNVKIKGISGAGELIGLLNTQSFLLKKGPKLYQLMSTNY